MEGGDSEFANSVVLEVRCDLSRHLARKITKRIHSSKPASLNRPKEMLTVCLTPTLCQHDSLGVYRDVTRLSDTDIMSAVSLEMYRDADHISDTDLTSACLTWSV